MNITREQCIEWLDELISYGNVALKFGDRFKRDSEMLAATRTLICEPDQFREATKMVSDTICEEAIDICRELYDRFVMGGWGPSDCHNYVQSFFPVVQTARATERERCIHLIKTKGEWESVNTLIQRIRAEE